MSQTTQEINDLEQLNEEEQERSLSGLWKKVMIFIAFFYGTFHFITALYPLPGLAQRSVHIGIGIILALAFYKERFQVKFDFFFGFLSIIFLLNVFRYQGILVTLLIFLTILTISYYCKMKLKTKKEWFFYPLIFLIILAGSSSILGWAGTYIAITVVVLGILILARQYLTVGRLSILVGLYLLYFIFTNLEGLSFNSESQGTLLFWICAGVALLALILGIIFKATKKKLPIPVFDICAMIFVVSASLFIILKQNFIANNPGDSSTALFIFGGILLLCILEAARRVMGIVFPLLALIFIIYGLFGPHFDGILGHRGLTSEQLIQELYISFRGYYGMVTSVTANVVGMFVVFGAILMVTGGGKTFMDLAMWIAGKRTGGPAKVAVVSSGMFGLVNGSAAANVAVTGSFTIPLMKKIGYKPHFAAAVEAVASTGGQLVPPIMGAAVFVMAELIDTPYSAIMKAAVIPAFLFYLSAMMCVHFRSKKRNLKGIDDENLIVRRKDVINLERLMPLFVPIAVLLYLIIDGYTPEAAAFWASILSIVFYFVFGSVKRVYTHKRLIPLGIGILAGGGFSLVMNTSEALLTGFIVTLILFAGLDFNESKEKFVRLIYGFVDAGKGLIMIAVLAGCAQIIIVIIGQTGLGVKFSSLISSFNESSLFLGLLVSMVICIILGMGVPTVAAYVIAASVVGVPLTQAGIDPVSAHLFLFYYALLSGITPPICAAVFIAAALARTNWLKTAFDALRIALPSFLIPFLFIYGESLLMRGSVVEIFVSVITAIIGIVGLSAGTMGYFLRENKLWETPILIVASILAIVPNVITSMVGIVIIGAILLVQKFKGRDGIHAEEQQGTAI